MAVGGFHSQAGWISFVGLALGFIAVTHRMRFFASVGQDGAGEKINPIAAALLVPFLVLMGSMMVTAAFSQGFDRLYPLRVLATAAALLWFRRVYARWDWGWSWPSVCIGVAVFILWIALAQVTTGDDTTLRAGIAALSPSETVAWIGFRVVGSVLVVPVVEEMAFRGYLLRRLVCGGLPGRRGEPVHLGVVPGLLGRLRRAARQMARWNDGGHGLRPGGLSTREAGRRGRCPRDDEWVDRRLSAPVRQMVTLDVDC